jgi:hypothetical protein
VRKAAPYILLMDGSIENVAAVGNCGPPPWRALDRVLSTLLVELDGWIQSALPTKRGALPLLGSHNVKWIDAALQRPGRLESLWNSYQTTARDSKSSQ